MAANRVSRLLLLLVIVLTPCSMAVVESKENKNKNRPHETKEAFLLNKKRDEPKPLFFGRRLKQAIERYIGLVVRCNPEPSVVNNTAFPSNLPSSSLPFTEKPLSTKSALPSVYPTQVS